MIKYPFILFGLGAFIGTFFLYQSTQDFLKDAVAAEGSVIELVRSKSTDTVTYSPIVEFKTKSGLSVEFQSSTGSNPASYFVGEKVGVLYIYSSPNSAKINSFSSLWGASVAVGVFGGIFFIIGLSLLIFEKRSGKKNQYLKKNGVPIKAKLQGVERNGSLEVNGRNPYQILAQWINPITSELHIFNSENIWFDPSDHMNIDEVTVLIEKDNPKKYYMDISFLPKVAG